jgi:hypothetical protein
LASTERNADRDVEGVRVLPQSFLDIAAGLER